MMGRPRAKRRVSFEFMCLHNAQAKSKLVIQEGARGAESILRSYNYMRMVLKGPRSSLKGVVTLKGASDPLGPQIE